MTSGISGTNGPGAYGSYDTSENSGSTFNLKTLYPNAPEWFSTTGLMEMIQRVYSQKKLGDMDLSDPKILNYLISELAEEKARELGTYSDATYDEVDALMASGFMAFFQEQLEQLQSRYADQGVGDLDAAQLARELEEALVSWSSGTDDQAFSERVDRLAQLFSEEPRMLIEWALLKFMAENPEVDLKTLNPAVGMAYLSEIFGVKEAAAASAKKVSAKSQPGDTDPATDVSSLSDVLDAYSGDGVEEHSDRETLLLIWSIIQNELEESFAEESTVAAETRKEMQQNEFAKYMEEKTKELQKSGTAKVWDSVKRWGGTIAACVAAAAAWVGVGVAFGLAGVAIAGASSVGVGILAGAVGIGAGLALSVAATALTAVAMNMVVTSIAKECGEDLDLFAELGKGIAKLLGADDELAEKIGMGTSIGINLALALTAGVCSLSGAAAMFLVPGPGTAVAVAAGIGIFTSLISAGCTIANGVIYGISAGTKLDLALTQADLVEIQGLLDQIIEARNVEQEVMAAILSKIFECIRGNVADAMDNTLESIDNIINMTASRA